MLRHASGHEGSRLWIVSIRGSLQSFGNFNPPAAACFHPTRNITLPASQFSEILERRTVTARAFEGVPLSTFSSKLRGEILSTLVRGIDGELHPGAQIEDAERSKCVNGAQRGRTITEYDWRRDGVRIECKSAQLKWSSERWTIQFQNIKFAYQDVRREASFDELYLAVYAPCGIYVYRHDLSFGVTSTGKRTAHRGHVVNVVGPVREDVSIALPAVLRKLEAGMRRDRVAFVSYGDSRVHVAARAHLLSGSTMDAYRNVPLAGLSTRARGGVLQDLVRAVDEILHPDAQFLEPPSGTRVNGASCGLYQGEFDWSRDLIRIVCKSSQLQWDVTKLSWYLRFHSVKFQLKGVRMDALFDELFLAIYTPLGVYIYRHGLSFGVSTNGLRSESDGFNIFAVGTKGEKDWRIALGTILSKLTKGGCKRVALVSWEH